MSPKNSETITFRLQDEALDSIDRIVRELTARAEGVEVTRSAAARQALYLGINVLREKLGIVDIILPERGDAPVPPAAKRKKRATKKP